GQAADAPAQPEDRDAHRDEHDGDADPGERAEERERSAGEAGEPEADHGQDGNAAAGETARPGGETDHAGQGARHAGWARRLRAETAGFPRLLAVRPERKVGAEDERGEQD